MLGHSSNAMTSDIYGHLVPGKDRTSVNLLADQILNPHSPRTQEKEKAVTHAGYSLNNMMVAMQGFEPRTLRI